MSDDTQSPLAPTTSPLTEADPNSINDLIADRINEIMNTKPLDITDQDLRVMVEYYRRERGRFILESQNKAASPRKSAAAKKEPPTSVKDALASNLDLI